MKSSPLLSPIYTLAPDSHPQLAHHHSRGQPTLPDIPIPLSRCGPCPAQTPCFISTPTRLLPRASYLTGAAQKGLLSARAFYTDPPAVRQYGAIRSDLSASFAELEVRLHLASPLDMALVGSREARRIDARIDDPDFSMTQSHSGRMWG
jgi:hypothetical protein